MLLIALSQTVFCFLNTSTEKQEMNGWQMVFLYHCFISNLFVSCSCCKYFIRIWLFFAGDSSFGFGYLTRTICYKIASNCRGEACYCKVPDSNRYLKRFVSLTFYWFCCFCQTIIALMWQLAKLNNKWHTYCI